MAFTNLSQFQKELRGSSSELAEEYRKFQLALALRALAVASNVTRVDTGRLRGGWSLTVGRPIPLADPQPDPGGTQVMGRGLEGLRDLRPYQTIWLNNWVDYASYLNDGTDKIPADMMLEQALAAIEGVTRG